MFVDLHKGVDLITRCGSAKLQIIPEMTEKFQDIHECLTQQLTEDYDKTDADTYWNQVVHK